MIHSIRQIALGGAVALTFAAVLGMHDDAASLRSGDFLSQAQARIGRPMTPMSYAGVARRTTRRSVAVGAGAVAAGAVVSGCQQVVDVYGRIVTQCY